MVFLCYVLHQYHTEWIFFNFLFSTHYYAFKISLSWQHVNHWIGCVVLHDQGLNLLILNWQADSLPLTHLGSPWWLSIKESTCNAGDWGSIPEWGRFPGEGNGNPLQYSCLRNSMDRGPGRPQSMGSQRVGHNCETNFHFSRNCTQYRADIVSKCSAKAHYCYCLIEGTLWVSDKFPFLEDDLVFFFWLEAPRGWGPVSTFRS